MGKVRSWKPAQRARGSSTTRVPQLRDSWEKRLQQRAERAAVQAAQAAIDDQIRTEKQARRTVASLTRHPPHPSLCCQAERKQREEKERRKEENKVRGMQYQVVRCGPAGSRAVTLPLSACCRTRHRSRTRRK